MGWRDTLKALRDRLFGIEAASPKPPSASTAQAPSKAAAPKARKAHTARSKEPANQPRAAVTLPSTTAGSKAKSKSDRPLPVVAINFGIDFGTSFTKVCFRDVGTEESGVVAFGAGRSAKHLLPTIVAIADNGALYTGDEAPKASNVSRIPYLKMRLAGGEFGDALPIVGGIDLNNPAAIRALASWFLARVLMRSQDWLAKHEKARLKNRRPVWSANVGVPVEHFDSDSLNVFREVLGVAWIWVKQDRMPTMLEALQPAYQAALPALEADIADFHAVPEIAAAVQSFVMSREAVPGIYVYFDIGGGTIDGVAFNFLNFSGERRINFYSGKVAPLGMSALANALGDNSGGAIEPALLSKLLANAGLAATAKFSGDVQGLVANVIVTAKRKDGRNWQKDAIQGRSYERKYIGTLDPSRMQPLIVFLGGGGARAAWYRSAISSTYEDYKHHKAGIPPYKLIEVPMPADFTMSGLDDHEFLRFAISYGLSIPFGEGPEVGLPSQFSEAERPQLWRPPDLVDYADSKDVYD
jgi:hypothetical protein